jgi:hypothetical protein
LQTGFAVICRGSLFEKVERHRRAVATLTWRQGDQMSL